jgi:anti-sigma B factor antagonist
VIRPFDITTEAVGGLSVVRLVGELDATDAPTLSRALISATKFTSRIVIDLSECEFIDSSGIAAIVEAWRGPDGPESRGNVVLAGASGQVDRIVRITGLHRGITVFDGVDEALAALLTTDEALRLAAEDGEELQAS